MTAHKSIPPKVVDCAKSADTAFSHFHRYRAVLYSKTNPIPALNEFDKGSEFSFRCIATTHSPDAAWSINRLRASMGVRNAACSPT
jgi:hypothetical protein